MPVMSEEQTEEALRAANKKQKWEKEAQQRTKELKEQKDALKKTEDENDRRIRERLCLKCGTPLGFLDKLSGRKEHKNC